MISFLFNLFSTAKNNYRLLLLCQVITTIIITDMSLVTCKLLVEASHYFWNVAGTFIRYEYFGN